MDNNIERYIDLKGLEQVPYSNVRKTQIYTVNHDVVPVYGKSIIEVIRDKRIQEDKKSRK